MVEAGTIRRYEARLRYKANTTRDEWECNDEISAFLRPCNNDSGGPLQ